MMNYVNFEAQYEELVSRVLLFGQIRSGRNGETKSLFGAQLGFDLSSGVFPLISARQIYYKGVLGELAAMLRGPTHVKDFEKFGCNYWKSWADPRGNLAVDYGNLWTDWNGYNQLSELRHELKHNPASRRLIISSWKPDTMHELSLPCCHYLYQFYVRDGKYLDMMWQQRSVDVMIGLPSDLVLAAVLNILIADDAQLVPGRVSMIFGDTHVYAEHYDNAGSLYNHYKSVEPPKYLFSPPTPFDLLEFTPDMLTIEGYTPAKKVSFKLKE